jgi:hypothetical protein
VTVEPPPLTYEDTARVLAKLADRQIVLVGGQAVNFWATVYEDVAPDLSASGPFASKDIDFSGTKAEVTECAARLAGTPVTAKPGNATPNAGVVNFVDDRGHRRQIDILAQVYGLQRKDIFETAVPVTIRAAEGVAAVTFMVLHPALCLESRTANVANWQGYDTPKDLKQLRASIVIAREFIQESSCRRTSSGVQLEQAHI